MKTWRIVVSLILVGCGGASQAPATSLSNASVPKEAPKPAVAEAAPEAAPPPAPITEAAETADDLPKIDFTPASDVRANTKAKLEAALKSIKKLTTPAAVTSALTASLGKPTWVENEARKIWVANDGWGCSRLVLEEDGSVNFESLRSTESKTLSRTARQNLCTGRIETIEPL